MKTLSVLRILSLCGIFTMSLLADGQAQVAKVSFNAAFNMLNTGSKNTTSKVASSGNSNAISMINAANYSKKVKISYGVPIEIVLEYAVVKSRLNSDMASDPDTYNNSSDNVQQAFVNLAYGDFVKISDYKKVNVKLNFRFNPAKLVIYGSDTGDFLNNTSSSPWDVQVYKTPNTPVSGTKIMVVQK
jgi:hypothetical protein